MPSSSLDEVEVEVEFGAEVEVGAEVVVEVMVWGAGVRFSIDQFRYSLDSVEILFRLGLGGWEDYSKIKTKLSQSFSLS